MASRSETASCAITSHGTQRISSADTSAASLGENDLPASLQQSTECSMARESLQKKDNQKEASCDSSWVGEDVQELLTRSIRDLCRDAPQGPLAPDPRQNGNEEQLSTEGASDRILPPGGQHTVSSHVMKTPHSNKHSFSHFTEVQAGEDSGIQESASSCTSPHSKRSERGRRKHARVSWSGEPTADSGSGCDGAQSWESFPTAQSNPSLACAAAYLNSNKWRLETGKHGKAATVPDTPPKPVVEDVKEAERFLRGVACIDAGKDHGRPSSHEAEENVRMTGRLSGDIKPADQTDLCLATDKANLQKAADPPALQKFEDSADLQKTAELSHLHSSAKFQAELFFKALLVQTQARIDAEAETSVVLAMHDELSSKIDSLQDAFEEICQELEAVRKENALLAQKAFDGDFHRHPSLEVTQRSDLSNVRGACFLARCGNRRESGKWNTRSMCAREEKDVHTKKKALLKRIQEKKLERKNFDTVCCINSVLVKDMFERMERKTNENIVESRLFEERLQRAEEEGAATNVELNEIKKELFFLKERCELLQANDRQTWRMLETLILANGEEQCVTLCDDACGT